MSILIRRGDGFNSRARERDRKHPPRKAHERFQFTRPRGATAVLFNGGGGGGFNSRARGRDNKIIFCGNSVVSIHAPAARDGRY